MIFETANGSGTKTCEDGPDCKQDSRSLPRALPFYLPYIVPWITLVAHYSNTDWHALIAPFFVWVIIPVLDYIVGKACPSFLHRLNVTQRKQLETKLAFKLAVLLWCPTQIGMLLWATHRVQQVEDPVTGLRLVGLFWSTSLIAAEGINCSHELFHRRSVLERVFGKVLLVSVLYGHFNIEHARGHHSRVATHDDPATFRYGESFYHFLPRTIMGGQASAWRLELARLKRHGHAWYSYRNELIVSGLLQIVLCLCFYILLGKRALFLFLFQAACAVLLLEQINAIEHYGLLRRQAVSGDYEPVGPRHSWDAPHRVSSYLLFKLQLHADHHLHASKRYQTLELTEGSPQLPAGYLSLIPLLLIPPAWRYVMDRALLKYWKEWDQEDRVKGFPTSGERAVRQSFIRTVKEHT